MTELPGQLADPGRYLRAQRELADVSRNTLARLARVSESYLTLRGASNFAGPVPCSDYLSPPQGHHDHPCPWIATRTWKEIERLTRSNVGCGPRRKAGCET